MLRTMLTPLVLPYTRAEWPGWGYAMRLAGGCIDMVWPDGETRTVSCKWAGGAQIALNMRDTFERLVYFVGRYYDLPSQLLFRSVVRPGETFVDVGANIGMFTLLGAHLVGPHGRVIAVEPNPEVFSRLTTTIQHNALAQVTLHPVGLSDSPDILTLTRSDDMSVHGSLCEPVPGLPVTSSHNVDVVRGDSLLDECPTDRPMTIKIDVEGFECRVLHGLAHTIQRHRPVIVTEAVDRWLQRAGSNLTALIRLMHEHGYKGLWLSKRRSRLRYSLTLHSVVDGLHHPSDADIVWFHRGDSRTALVAAHMCS